MEQVDSHYQVVHFHHDIDDHRHRHHTLPESVAAVAETEKTWRLVVSRQRMVLVQATALQLVVVSTSSAERDQSIFALCDCDFEDWVDSDLELGIGIDE